MKKMFIRGKFRVIRRAARPYRGIILFVALLFLFHYLWKVTVSNDGSEASGWVLRLRSALGIPESEDGFDRMYFLGRDVTPAWFWSLERCLTEAAACFVRLFPGYGDVITDGVRTYFPGSDYSTLTVWGCLGLKQLFIFTGIMCFYTGPFTKKLWYIPLGWLVLTAYNVVRIGLISILTRYSPGSFEPLHDGVFRYIYYILLFVIWVIWAEYLDVRKHEARCRSD